MAGEDNKMADDGSKAVEIDYSKLDAMKIPDEVARQTGAFGGLLREHQDLRGTTQDLRTTLEKQQNVEGNQVDDEIDPLESLKDVDDGEPVSAGEIKKIVAAQEAKAKKAGEKDASERKKTETRNAQESQKVVRAESEKRLKTKYTPETHPGLDGATVITVGGAWLRANEPDLFLAAFHGASDPAQVIYNLAISLCPELKKVAATKSSEQLLDSINRGTIPKGVAGVDGEYDYRRGDPGGGVGR